MQKKYIGGTMEVKIVFDDITKVQADAIVVNLFEDVKQPSGATAAVDKALDGEITKLIEQGEIKGKLNEVNIIHSFGKTSARIIAIAGLGKQNEFTLDKVRSVIAQVCRSLRKLNCQRIASILHGTGSGGFEPALVSQALIEGSILGLYSFRKYITKKPDYADVSELIIVDRDSSVKKEIEQGSQRGEIIADAAVLARNWINEPSNYMTPNDMAQVAKKMAKTYGLGLTIMEREQMEKEGMGALLGVAQGSDQPPKLIILEYKGNNASKEIIGFIGKGITFDSGGISIKPSDYMKDMKGDMSGGAAVLAAMSAIAQLKPKVNIMALIPAAENLPSGKAIKPGDILTASNGKTIEVVNTDAEGRLIMADALSYAVKKGISPLLDIATLTGACHIALGDLCSGVFGNNQDVSDKIIKAGEKAGERMWQLPMYDEYKEQNKSEIADIKNTGGRYGGAITAAKFLSEFVGDTPWVHIDIAGTFESDKEKGYVVKGATGVGVRTLINLAFIYATD
jgi:leucyl aminopeptidase